MKRNKQEPCVQTMVFVVGMFSALMSGFLMVPMLVNILHGRDWHCFCYSSIIAATTGSILCAVNGKKLRSIQGVEVVSLTCFVWIVLVIQAAIPFLLSDTARLSLVNAMFEAMSGLTTTGATVMSDLSSKSPGVLLWRAMLNAMGGLGVVTVGIFLLPDMKIVGLKEMYGTEAVGRRFRFGVLKTVLYISTVYLILMFLCALSYRIAGMSTFDAICHAMTTVSTGGFSNYDNSIMHFQSITIELIAVLFMLLASCPFIVYLKLALDRSFDDLQYPTYLCILAISTLICVTSSSFNGMQDEGFLNSLRYSLFSIVSLSTSTGYSNCDYSECTIVSLLGTILALCGGCSGSTNSGIKIHRLRTMAISTLDYVRSIFKSGHTVITASYQKQSARLEARTIFFLYLALFCVSCTAVAWRKYDQITAITAVASTLSNTGIGSGQIVGPNGNFSSFAPDMKLLFIAMMFLGRLEIIPVIMFFTTILRNGICWMSNIFRKCEKT